MTEFQIGDFAERIEEHPLVHAGEVHEVIAMYRGGYLGFAKPIGGEWNPAGWRKVVQPEPQPEASRSPVERIMVLIGERKAIYQAKLDAATDGERFTDDYSRCDLFQHTVEAFEHLEAEIATDTQPVAGGGE